MGSTSLTASNTRVRWPSHGKVRSRGLFFLAGRQRNFITSLLTEAHALEEKGKTQALNNFLVFSTVTQAVLSACSLQHRSGWQAVNYGVVPLIAVTVSTVTRLLLRRRMVVALQGDA